MRLDIVPGGVFPDYTARSHGGPAFAQRAAGRCGHYYPKEHQQHLELAAFYPKITVAYAQIITITIDDRHTLQKIRASVGAGWIFLSDPGRMIQKHLCVQEYTDPEHDPMIPHTLVLKPGLVIHSMYNGYWFRGRPAVVDLWRDLRTATREIRADWDLSSPGLRAAWDARDLTRCHCHALTDPTGLDCLAVRAWVCKGCSVTHDRDVNSAINILAAARVSRAVGGHEPSRSTAPPNQASRLRKTRFSAVKVTA